MQRRLLKRCALRRPDVLEVCECVEWVVEWGKTSFRSPVRECVMDFCSDG